MSRFTPPAARLKPPEDGIIASNRPSGWLGKEWKALIDQLATNKAEESRLARGRNQARAGRVRGLWISPGLASAQVYDTDTWNISARVRTFTDTEWKKLIKVLLGNLQYVAALLEGYLPQELVAELHRKKIPLLPARHELDGDCDCDDYARPCAHMAAVHTVLGDALDGEPFLLLTLRGRTRQQILSTLRSAWGDPEQSTPGALAKDEPPPETEDWFDSPTPLPPWSFKFAAPEHIAAGLRTLGPPPGQADLCRALEPLYLAGGAAAAELALQEHDFPIDNERVRAFKRTVKRPSATPPDTPQRRGFDDADKRRPSNLTESIVDALAEMEHAKSKDLAKRVGASLAEVREELLELERLGIVYRTGQTRGTRWWLG